MQLIMNDTCMSLHIIYNAQHLKKIIIGVQNPLRILAQTLWKCPKKNWSICKSPRAFWIALTKFHGCLTYVLVWRRRRRRFLLKIRGCQALYAWFPKTCDYIASKKISFYKSLLQKYILYKYSCGQRFTYTHHESHANIGFSIICLTVIFLGQNCYTTYIFNRKSQEFGAQV